MGLATGQRCAAGYGGAGSDVGAIEGRVHRAPGGEEAVRVRPTALPAMDRTPIVSSVRELGLLEFRQVRRTADERCFNSLLESHHYLGYTQPVGEQLKFMVYADARPVALFAWSSAARHLGPRDRYLRWVGACQGSCRLSYAADAVLFSDASAALTTSSRSGLSVTVAMGCQLRVWRLHRRGWIA